VQPHPGEPIQSIFISEFIPIPKETSFTLYAKVFNLIQSRGTLDTHNYFYTDDDT